MISIEQKKSPIETIEGDAFISTAFVENLFLDGIKTRILKTNTFRGLSYCKYLHLSNSLIEEIEPNAFFRTNNIEKINFKNSKLKFVHKDAFRGLFNIKTIDLRGNYLRMVDRNSFEQLIAPKVKREQNVVVNDTLRVFDIENNNFIVNKILFEQNPIQCDCNLKWILDNKYNQEYIKLPEICAGPRGYDCLRVKDLTGQNLNCDQTDQISTPPCQDIIFEITNFNRISQNERINPENFEKDQIMPEGHANELDYPKNMNRYETTSSKLSYPTTTVNWSKTKQTNELKLSLKGLLNHSLGLSNCSNQFLSSINCLILIFVYCSRIIFKNMYIFNTYL